MQTTKYRKLSEGGARIVLAGQQSLEVGQAFTGVVRFHDGSAVFIAGTVLRSDEEEVAVQLSTGLSMSRMIQEQTWLQREYPRFLREVTGLGDPEL